MEEASTYDLKLATNQGTIQSIQVNGISYGGTSARSSGNSNAINNENVYSAYISVSSLAVGLAVVLVGGLLARFHCKRRVITTAGDDLPLDQPVLQA